ncbi:phospholipase [Vibrio sp. S9_S30]|uniref:PAAR domain-containing protein n=1 Tax=Vibrio sp. S9_S30 TaxID=2720226 RepID=UPI00168140A8|nr:PAAR domain-containing protein [Vibrio sp. S9_S30]MBD1557002.1 phospholipase [Vibrio sp. S9_S30]
MPAAARLGDSCAGHGCFPATPIVAGSSDVFINGKPAARQGDTVLLHACPCPNMPHGIHGRSISAGSSTVSINGKPASRVGDAIGCGGSVAAGSGNVFIGDTPYSSPAHKCAEGAAASKSPFLKITPLAEPLGTGWGSSIFTPEFYKSALQKMAVQADIALLNKALEMQELSSLAQSIITAVENGADKQAMLEVLETNTTKAERRKAREELTARGKSAHPDQADRFAMDMDAAEKAMLSSHIYTLDKKDSELNARQLKLKRDMTDDSGWSEASPSDLKRLGIREELLVDPDSNYRAQVYMPDKDVFGPDAKPTVVFRGTEGKTDWLKANVPQGIGKGSSYHEKAVKIGQILSKNGDSVEFSGHSLGGGLASAASKSAKMPAITFNSAGLHKKTLPKYGIDSSKQGTDTAIIGYRLNDEILTYVQEDMFLTKRFFPDAVRNADLDTDLEKPSSLSQSISSNPSLKDRLELHGIDHLRDALEERKVNDLFELSKSNRL